MLPSVILICCTGPFWSDSLCLFGFCLLSLWCLISALTQAGRGDLLFRFASSVQSCYREGGVLQTDIALWRALPMFRPHWVCPAHGCLCFPRLHCSGSRLLYMERALRWVRFQFSGPPQKRGFRCARVLCLPRPQWFRQPGAWAPSPWRRALSSPRLFPPRRAAQAARGLGALCPDAAHLFPLRPQHAPPVGSQEVFRQELGACLQCGRGWLLWGWVCPFPLPPASYLQWGWACSSLEFLSPFVLPTAGSVFIQA